MSESLTVEGVEVSEGDSVRVVYDQGAEDNAGREILVEREKEIDSFLYTDGTGFLTPTVVFGPHDTVAVDNVDEIEVLD